MSLFKEFKQAGKNKNKLKYLEEKLNDWIDFIDRRCRSIENKVLLSLNDELKLGDFVKQNGKDVMYVISKHLIDEDHELTACYECININEPGELPSIFRRDMIEKVEVEIKVKDLYCNESCTGKHEPDEDAVNSGGIVCKHCKDYIT